MRNIAVDTLLEGRVLTHRLTEQEVGSDIIDSMDDLSPITTLLQFADDPAGLRTTYRYRRRRDLRQSTHDDPHWPPSEALVLPQGTLRDYNTTSDFELQTKPFVFELGGRISFFGHPLRCLDQPQSGKCDERANRAIAEGRACEVGRDSVERSPRLSTNQQTDPSLSASR